MEEEAATEVYSTKQLMFARLKKIHPYIILIAELVTFKKVRSHDSVILFMKTNVIFADLFLQHSRLGMHQTEIIFSLHFFNSNLTKR